ncbi:MATE family efflux transporter [Pseudomonas huanghezhanensis]|uniref:MATE family efflux transporter n=1 Tax=Pseudomonas huanghezhanensis TaxID=3002903 RepID=UPI002286A6F3|nr:MATE family efflux transporter [Pseudomonas sp. BSw22131]
MANARATFTEGRVARHILVMTSTIALSLLAVFLVDILTLVYVAKLHDPVLLAAVGIAKVLIFFNGAIASGFIIAAASVLSERISERETPGFARLTGSLMLMVMIASGLTAAVQLALVFPVTHMLGADDVTYPVVRSFIWLTLPFTVAQSAMQMSAQILRTTGDSRRALWVVLSGAATLAVADPLFIFVLGLGIKGAGLAYALSAVVSASLGAFWLRKRVGLLFSTDWALLREHMRVTFKIALPAIVANLATPVGLAYLFSSLAAYGTSTLAAMAVVDRVMQFAYCAFFSLPTALAPVLGQNIGARRDDRVGTAIVFTRRLVVAYGLAVWGVLILSSGLIADLYELEGPGRAMFVAFCQIGGGLWAIIGLDFVAISVFVTMDRSWLVAAFAWARATLAAVPFIYVGTHLFGGSGALPGMFAGNALIAIISIFTASLTAKRFFQRRAQPA